MREQITTDKQAAADPDCGLGSRVAQRARDTAPAAAPRTAHGRRAEQRSRSDIRSDIRAVHTRQIAECCGTRLWDLHRHTRRSASEARRRRRRSVCPLAACGRASDAMSKVPARHGPAHRFMLLVCHAVVCACAQTVAAHVDDHNHPRQMGPPAAFLAAALPGLGCVEAALLLVALRSLAVAGRAVALPP